MPWSCAMRSRTGSQRGSRMQSCKGCRCPPQHFHTPKAEKVAHLVPEGGKLPFGLALAAEGEGEAVPGRPSREAREARLATLWRPPTGSDADVVPRPREAEGDLVAEREGSADALTAGLREGVTDPRGLSDPENVLQALPVAVGQPVAATVALPEPLAETAPLSERLCAPERSRWGSAWSGVMA